jgi:hypothetical protein
MSTEKIKVAKPRRNKIPRKKKDDPPSHVEGENINQGVTGGRKKNPRLSLVSNVGHGVKAGPTTRDRTSDPEDDSHSTGKNEEENSHGGNVQKRDECNICGNQVTDGKIVDETLGFVTKDTHIRFCKIGRNLHGSFFFSLLSSYFCCFLILFTASSLLV